jgi:effector-binding domain-containing protein
VNDTSTLPAPVIVERAAQPYVAYREAVTMQSVAAPARRFAEIYAWLGDQGIAPAGAPFYKYDLIDMAHELVIEAGVPVATVPDVPGEMVAGTLPAGRYATVTHVGHPDELMEVTRRLLEWGAQQGLTWDHTETANGDAWACRLEIYHSNPQDEPDMAKWVTDLAFRLAD